MALGYLVGAAVSGTLTTPRTLLREAEAPVAAVDPLARRARGRLDVTAAEKSAAALEASSDEALLRAVPTLDLVGTARTTNETGFSGRNLDGSLGVTLTWILWDGGVASADRAERIALANAGDLDAEGTARLAELEVRSASEALDAGQAALLQAQAAVRAAEQNSRETSQLYKSGLATALSVADAGAQLFAAEVDLVRARYGLAQALLEQRRAAGLDPLGREPR
jgi:outer membrane protein TolC